MIHYQHRHDRARKTIRGIDEQVAKAQRAVDGHAPVKRNRYIQLTGATKSVNRELEAKTRALAGWKGYVTNIGVDVMPGVEVIAKYHDLWHVERSFRMSRSDLRARPMFHRTRDAIEAHLTIVFAAMAVAHCIQERTGLAIANVVKQLRSLRSATIVINGVTETFPPEIPAPQRKILASLGIPEPGTKQNVLTQVAFVRQIAVEANGIRALAQNFWISGR